ncbi:transglycosylase domain-containing protein [Kutzneria sp. NPDC052558]|uniref:transglycosylase domain-containing protein n=1 Tax=Kutzneria sp. NPDC052558 TaxID=3364121 RepID=UPI0037CAE1A5
MNEEATHPDINWRRVRRFGYVVAAVVIGVPLIAFGITYGVVATPDPKLVADQQQTVTLYYSDGSVMTTIGPTGGGNRTVVQISQVPRVVQKAVEAAEDETFETNIGLGGITTQFVRLATGADAQSLPDQWVQLVRAAKLGRQQSKDDILAGYLNLVYLGRGAYGIQAAAQAYFGKNVGELDASEAAFLAGCIDQPAKDEDETWTKQQWTHVLDRMVANGWLGQDERARYTVPPKPIMPVTGSLPPARSFIVQQVLAEAKQMAGLDEDVLRHAGAQVHTTIDPKAQTMAESAAQSLRSADPDVGDALVSINPSTGAIVSWFGGDNPAQGVDTADNAAQPGPTFQPLVLMAALRTSPQITLASQYDGTSPLTIGGVSVKNFSGADCGPQCALGDAMHNNTNTVFYKLTDDIGPAKVATTAFEAGVAQTQTIGGKTGPALRSSDKDQTTDSIAMGSYPVRPRDMAQAYATLAANGKYTPAHFINAVVASTGVSLYDAKANAHLAPTQVFETAQAKMVTQSMLTGPGLDGGRPVAAKAGSTAFLDTADNSDAWTVGYTPQVVTAVWVGHRKDLAPMKEGVDVPTSIWQQYMNAYLQGKPATQF